MVTLAVDERHPEGSEPVTVAIERDALRRVLEEDPRPPELLLDLLAERAVRRMPLPNGEGNLRVITPHNLALVWPK
ncbi:MAG: hypothetical protein K6U14_01330 [Firmicutes bacterium]|nr:hypothetical protein [Alicyclobacillaceae bacterium]MCL6496261.1 hypothetical protein [Bacillota bacterium]